MALDILGLDILGLDILGLDILGRFQLYKPSSDPIFAALCRLGYSSLLEEYEEAVKKILLIHNPVYMLQDLEPKRDTVEPL